MSDPRKHHYLPQLYLEGFKIEPQQTKKPHIWQVEKAGNQKHYSPAIDATSCIRDFHTLDFSDQDPDHKAIETILSRIESEQAELIRGIAKAGRVSSDNVEPLATFISLMRFRVPAFANHVETTLQAVLSDSFKIMYQSGQLGAPPKGMLELIKSKGIDGAIKFDISNWKIVQQMLEMGLSSASIGILGQLKFHLYTNSNRGFITSDNPVALYHPNYDEIRPYGIAPGIKGTEVTFPISSDILVFCGWDVEEGTSAATEQQVAEFNRRTIVMAERYVFANRVTDEIRQQIGEHQDMRAGFVFDKVGPYHMQRFIPVE